VLPAGLHIVQKKNIHQIIIMYADNFFIF
jgi:hypothetical protein